MGLLPDTHQIPTLTPPKLRSVHPGKVYPLLQSLQFMILILIDFYSENISQVSENIKGLKNYSIRENCR